MTEAEWVAGSDLHGMLDFLVNRGSQRKLRLFACACCRQIIPGFLESEPDRLAVELTERDVDGQAREEDFDDLDDGDWDFRWYRRDAWDLISRMLNSDWGDLTGLSEEEQLRWHERANAEAAKLLADIFGNPFHPSSLHPASVTSTMRALAQAAYEERKLPTGCLDPNCLAILADALEEASCTDVTLLGHLRGPGPHVRGCWAADVLLGKS
jgi:hypothetical protein